MCPRICPRGFASRLVFGTAALCLAISVLIGQEAQPPAKPKDLTPEQQEKLKERDRLKAEVEKLRKEEKLAEAVAAAGKMRAIEAEVFGKESEEVAESLATLAEMHEERDDFVAARQLRVEALQIVSKRHGDKDWQVADADGAIVLGDQIGKLSPENRRRLMEAGKLAKQAAALKEQGNLPDAASLLVQALEIRQRLLGEHPATALALNQLGLVLRAQGNFDAAMDYFQRALDMRSKLYPAERYPSGHPELARSLNNMGSALQPQGHYGRALDYYQQALAMRQQLYPPGRYPGGHPELAISLSYLGFVLDAQGDHRRALDYYQQALAMFQKLYPVERYPVGHSDVAKSLDNLGGAHSNQGEYSRALEYHQQALAMFKKLYPAERYPNGHPQLAVSLSNMGVVLKAQGDHDRALDYHQLALAMHQKLYPAEHYPGGHPALALNLNNLGGVLTAQGDYGRAQEFYQQALAMQQKLYPAERYPSGHPHLALSLSLLGGVFGAQGDHARALDYHQRALAMRQKLYSTGQYPNGHPELATSLNDLAVVLQNRAEYRPALDYYQRALAMRQKLYTAQRYPNGHPQLANSLNNLGSVFGAQGDHVWALDYYQQTLAMCEKLYLSERYPTGHPDLATSLHNLAFVLQNQGEYRPALDYYRRALAMKQRLYPADRYPSGHPDLAVSLNYLGFLLHAQGDYGLALDTFGQAVDMIRKHLAIAAIGQTEALQLTLGQSLRRVLDGYLSVALVVEKPEPVYQAALAWKGAVTQRQEGLRLARSHPDIADLWQQLESTNRRLTTRWYRPPEPKEREAWDRDMRDLNAERERLETELSRKSADFRKRQERQQLTSERRHNVLPERTALIDFLEFTHYRRPEGGKGKWKTERRLAAFVVRRDAPVQLLDLGSVEPIVRAVTAWLSNTGRSSLDSEQSPGAELRRLVWQPLEKHLEGADVVLISPDGALCGLPFAALPGKQLGTYLLEERTVAVIAVPRGLPELMAQKSSESGGASALLVVGDIDYGSDPGKPQLLAEAKQRAGPFAEWPALSGTAAEIAAIGRRFKRTFPQGTLVELSEGNATEETLRANAANHHYLHVATHGFFAPEKIKSALAPAATDRLASAEPFTGKPAPGIHPGLLSGLVLAGANRPADPEKDDGILTSLEVAGLDLSKVDLAVLSACETGLGEVAGGEGLLGLQRAFQTAGARSVVASLWKVDDKATRQLMIDFYDNLWQKKLPKAAALRQAQLKMLKEGAKDRGLGTDDKPADKDNRLPPYYWAGFVLSGDWR